MAMLQRIDDVILRNEINKLFNFGSVSSQPEAFVPPVDIYEDEHKIVLKLEVPGMKQEDLDVKIENNKLTVRGERKLETEEKEANFRRMERTYGSFSRSFTVPANRIDQENVKAGYEAGVLRIELAKRAEARPKQIKVQVGAVQVNDTQRVEDKPAA